MQNINNSTLGPSTHNTQQSQPTTSGNVEQGTPPRRRVYGEVNGMTELKLQQLADRIFIFVKSPEFLAVANGVSVVDARILKFMSYITKMYDLAKESNPDFTIGELMFLGEGPFFKFALTVLRKINEKTLYEGMVWPENEFWTSPGDQEICCDNGRICLENNDVLEAYEWFCWLTFEDTNRLRCFLLSVYICKRIQEQSQLTIGADTTSSSHYVANYCNALPSSYEKVLLAILELSKSKETVNFTTMDALPFAFGYDYGKTSLERRVHWRQVITEMPDEYEPHPNLHPFLKTLAYEYGAQIALELGEYKDAYGFAFYVAFTNPGRGPVVLEFVKKVIAAAKSNKGPQGMKSKMPFFALGAWEFAQTPGGRKHVLENTMPTEITGKGFKQLIDHFYSTAQIDNPNLTKQEFISDQKLFMHHALRVLDQYTDIAEKNVEGIEIGDLKNPNKNPKLHFDNAMRLLNSTQPDASQIARALNLFASASGMSDDATLEVASSLMAGLLIRVLEFLPSWTAPISDEASSVSNLDRIANRFPETFEGKFAKAFSRIITLCDSGKHSVKYQSINDLPFASELLNANLTKEQLEEILHLLNNAMAYEPFEELHPFAKALPHEFAAKVYALLGNKDEARKEGIKALGLNRERTDEITSFFSELNN